jgi:hypothetical protein
MTAIGMRVPRKTHAPLSLPGTLSTAGHRDQSSIAVAISRNLYLSTVDRNMGVFVRLLASEPQTTVAHFPLQNLGHNRSKFIFRPHLPSFQQLTQTRQNRLRGHEKILCYF